MTSATIAALMVWAGLVGLLAGLAIGLGVALRIGGTKIGKHSEERA